MITVHMCMVWPCYCFVDGLSSNALMCIKKVKLIKHDCLPTLMLLNIMQYIVLTYLMLFAALSNAVCLYNASFLPMISAIAFYCYVLSWFIDT